MEKERKSNLELLRILAMFFILFYHFISYFILPLDESAHFLESMILLFHVGVLLFIFISGYFKIKPSVSGGVKILLRTFLYYVPLQIVIDFLEGTNMITIFKDLCVISYGHYWFITTYLLFYLLSPMVNVYLEKVTPSQRIYMLSILAFINIWIGRVTVGQPFFFDGKNVINFLFLYLIGNTVRYYKPFLKKIKCSHMLLIFTIYNILVVGTYYFNVDNVVGRIIMKLCYGYNSPGLIVNALLLFVIFLKIKFKSAKINFISSSVFAVYLITDQAFVRSNILKYLVEQTYCLCEDAYAKIILLVCLALAIMSVCICIDKLLTPVWNISSKKIANLKKYSL